MIDASTTATEWLTTEELARRTGVPVRTVRFYQSKGLLPAPERIGREARYHGMHLERLQLISELQHRGLRLTAIAEVLSRAGDQGSLPAWLGLSETLVEPWTEDRPALLSEVELATTIGERPVTAADLERAGLVERRSDTTPVTFLVPSPALLDLGLQMVDAGIDLATGGAARDLLQRRLGRLADELVAQITNRVTMDRLAQGGPAEVATLIDRLRPIARRSVDVVFAHEMERALRAVVEPGSTKQAKQPEASKQPKPAEQKTSTSKRNSSRKTTRSPKTTARRTTR